MQMSAVMITASRAVPINAPLKPPITETIRNDPRPNRNPRFIVVFSLLIIRRDGGRAV